MKYRSIRLYIKDPDNLKYIILIQYVSNKENVLINMLILNGKQHLENNFKKNNLEDNIYFAISDFDYFNNKIRV